MVNFSKILSKSWKWLSILVELGIRLAPEDWWQFIATSPAQDCFITQERKDENFYCGKIIYLLFQHCFETYNNKLILYIFNWCLHGAIKSPILINRITGKTGPHRGFLFLLQLHKQFEWIDLKSQHNFFLHQNEIIHISAKKYSNKKT